MNKIKIKISEEAYKQILSLLNLNKDYTHLRLEKGNCCKNKVSLILDTPKPGDIEDCIENLPLLYNMELANLLKEITIVYRENSFMIKALNIKDSQNLCNNCTKSKEGCTNCNRCSGCIKTE